MIASKPADAAVLDRVDAQLAPEAFPAWQLETIAVTYEVDLDAVFLSYKKDSAPHFSPQVLADLLAIRRSLPPLYAYQRAQGRPYRYVLIASEKPGIFNLGGDLDLFASAVPDPQTLRHYALTCIDLIHALTTGFDLPIVTYACVQGLALGGGLESSIAQDFIIADSDARFGVPEIKFNTYPGMGAVSLLTRRLGAARAQEIISQGKIYTAREFYDLGLVHYIIPPETPPREALRIATQATAFETAFQIASMRRLNAPSYDELTAIVVQWIACVGKLGKTDLRLMKSLVAAQKTKTKA